MEKKIVIATHDGMFHSDDVFAVATLLTMLDSVPALTSIVRTRDEALIRKADFVVDVGGVHDEDKNYFDHHQIGGGGKRPDGIPYAAFGLVWKKFGEKVALSPEAALLIDQKLVSAVDAGDNGIDIYKKVFSGVEPYLVNDYFHSLRPTWKESPDTLDSNFLEAVAIARQILKREIAHAEAFISAEPLVRQAYDVAEDKRLIIFDRYYPHEKTLATYAEPLFVVFPRPDGLWNAKSIRADSASFKNRKDFPETWAGKRGEELASVTGVSDALFCHNARFIASAKSKEGAIKLAKLALIPKV